MGQNDRRKRSRPPPNVPGSPEPGGERGRGSLNPAMPKPREERPFSDYFPDLDPTAPLVICRTFIRSNVAAAGTPKLAINPERGTGDAQSGTVGPGDGLSIHNGFRVSKLDQTTSLNPLNDDGFEGGPQRGLQQSATPGLEAGTGSGVPPTAGIGLSQTPGLDSSIAEKNESDALAKEPISVTPQKRKAPTSWEGRSAADGTEGAEKRLRQASEPPSPVRAGPLASLADLEAIERQQSAPPGARSKTPQVRVPLPLASRMPQPPSLADVDLPALLDPEARAKLGTLPRPRYTKIEESALALAAENEEMHYRRPEGHYIRYVDPTEIELYENTEYDMDEQDRYWLSVLNAERKTDGEPDVPEAFFEAVIDKLDKEWFNLVGDIGTDAAGELLISYCR